MLKLNKLALIFLLIAPSVVMASGHGPLFGLATPVNFKNTWTLDFGEMNRRGAVSTDISVRALLAYGITEDITASFSAPYMFRGVKLVPGRQAGTMPGTSDFEAYGSWRFHKKALGIGERIESTIYGGIIVPSGQQTHDFFGDHKETQGFWGGAATGYISRIHYVWLGASYTGYHKSSRGDQRPSSLFYSAVYGFRPPFGKKEFPHWDLRVLAELTGEKTEAVDHHEFIVSNSKGHSIFLGPSILALYKQYSVQAGLQLPIYKDVGDYYEDELARFAFNFSILF
jgi:hypothetical protein